MSAKKDIFTGLQSIFDYTDKFKHVGIWHGESLDPDGLEQFNRPAIKLEFGQINWQQQNTQESTSFGGLSANIPCNIHILIDSPKNEEDMFSDIEGLRDELKKFFTVWEGTTFNHPILLGEETMVQQNRMRDLVLSVIFVAYEPEQATYNPFEQTATTFKLELSV
jgi:hypothetical protein